MPIYEYRCEDGHVSQWLAPADRAPAELACPKICEQPPFATWGHCGKPAQRIMSAPALKHDGAYSHKPDLAA